MPRRPVFVVSWLLALLVTAAPVGAAKHENTPHSSGLLWKIERDAQRPSYIFGTIHIGDARVTALPGPVRATLDGADSFTMETVLDQVGIQSITDAMFFRDGRTLSQVAGRERYVTVEHTLANHGAPRMPDLNSIKPWFIIFMLSVPPQIDALDVQLQARATANNIPVYGLEKVREQIAIFDDLSMADQMALLDNTLVHHGTQAQTYERLIQAYLARDLNQLQRILDEDRLADQRLDDLVNHRLLTTRNVRMVERMQPRLSEGNAFVAIGAAHLYGEQGVLALLENAGWRVTPIY